MFVVAFAVVWGGLRVLCSHWGWVACKGEVTVSEIKYEKRESPNYGKAAFYPDWYTVVVEYKYSFREAGGHGSRVFPWLKCGYTDRAAAEAMQRRFPAGASIPVYVRAGNSRPGSSTTALALSLVQEKADRVVRLLPHKYGGRLEREETELYRDGPVSCLVPDFDIKAGDAVFAALLAAAGLTLLGGLILGRTLFRA
jgi:hypothetical protein